MRYHLNINGDTSGPFSQFAVVDRIRDGTLPKDALVWRQGFDQWRRADEVEEFDSYWPKEHTVIADEDDVDEIEIENTLHAEADRTEDAKLQSADRLPPELGAVLNKISDDGLRPRPWLRFWARMIDYMLYLSVVMVFILLFFPTDALQKIMLLSARHIPVESLFILGYLPIEAWFLSRFGKTPGRALLRMEVLLEHNAQKLTYRQALIRSLQVYVKGIGLWLPLVSLFAMTISRLYLLRNGRTSWDENCGTMVISRPLEGWRIAVLTAIVLFLILTALIGLLVQPEMIKSLQMQAAPQI